MNTKFKTALSIGLAAVLSGAMFQAHAADKSISVLKGKCGEGKCGTARVRNMMDNNKDGMIDRKEYVSWSTAQAVAEFDKISNGASSTTADAVFQNFLEWQSISETHGEKN